MLVVCSYCPNVSASMTPDDDGCYFLAYTYDGYNHYSLLKNNSSLIGNDLRIESNCDNIELYANNMFISGGITNFTINIPLDTQTIKIIAWESNTSSEHDYYDVFVFPAADWNNYLESNFNNFDNPITLSLSDFNTQKIMVVIFSSLIIWFISTAIIWRLVNRYVDKFHFEEVVN